MNAQWQILRARIYLTMHVDSGRGLTRPCSLYVVFIGSVNLAVAQVAASSTTESSSFPSFWRNRRNLAHRVCPNRPRAYARKAHGDFARGTMGEPREHSRNLDFVPFFRPATPMLRYIPNAFTTPPPTPPPPRHKRARADNTAARRYDVSIVVPDRHQLSDVRSQNMPPPARQRRGLFYPESNALSSIYI